MGAGDMSRDRVEFAIPVRRLEDFKYRRLIMDCFGLKENEIPRGYHRYSKEKFHIIARPSQFARFIVLRHDRGFQNMVKELDAKLILPPLPVQQPLEVWDRPALKQ